MAYGKFFLCRSIVPPFKIVAVATVVQDPLGLQAVRLALYNFVPETNRKFHLEQLQKILPVGTILAIKNPWLKLTADGGLTVRSDNPGDVFVVNQKMLDEICPGLQWKGDIPSKYIPKEIENVDADSGVIDFKSQGNIHYAKHEYPEAIVEYTNGIDDNKSQNRMELFSNRAAAYLQLEKFELALADCENALQLDSKHLKAQYRKVKALWGLGKYEEANDFSIKTWGPAFEMSKLSFNEQQSIAELLKKAKRNLVQSKFGEYDMVEIVAAAEKKQQLGKLDWAEFNGAIKVQSAGCKGRGIFATQEFQPGQLIMASRAFAAILDDGEETGLEYNFHINLSMGDRQMHNRSHDQLVTEIAHKLNNNPEKASEFYSLFAGPDLGYLEMDQASSTYIDMTRLRKICDYNRFSHHIRDNVPALFRNPFALGLWIMPSFLNHSCVDNNAHWNIYGDFLFVRANKRILPGDEILIAYQCPSTPAEIRREYQAAMHFQCSCRICVLDEQDSEETRTKIMEIWNKFNDFSKHDSGPRSYPFGFEKSTKNYIALLRAIRPNNLLLHPALLKPLDILSKFYYQNRQFGKCLNVLEQLHSLETELNMKISGVGHVTNILACVLQTQPKNKVLVNSWINKWKEASVLVFGTSKILPTVAPATLLLASELGYKVLP